MRTAVLWTLETDYFWASIRELRRQGHEVLVCTWGRDDASPHELNAGGPDVGYLVQPSGETLCAALNAFRPELALVAGWHIRPYVQAARYLRGRCGRVLVMDNQWRATLKQRAGQVAFRTTLRTAYDFALVPGPRQVAFAQHMGFAPTDILVGGIPCNQDLFDRPADSYGRSFISAGRLAPEKGIHVLLDAYQRYRATAEDPWELIICGTGSLPRPELDGVRWHGFADPPTLADLLSEAGCFVLASVFEPWAVVLQEAAAAGRPIIASHECGAVGTFVLDGINGYVTRTGDAADLAEAMARLSAMPAAQRRRFGLRSKDLARRSSPQTWVDALVQLHSKWACSTRQYPPDSSSVGLQEAVNVRSDTRSQRSDGLTA